MAGVQGDGKGGYAPLPNEEKTRIKKLMEDILSRLKQGESFDKLCELNSQDTDSRDYIDPLTKATIKGYIGPVYFSGEYAPQQKKMYGEALYSQMQNFPIGKYTNVLESPLGYHIFLPIKKSEGGIMTYEEALPRIIQMFRYFDQDILYQNEMKALLAELKKKASIVYLNNEYKE
jgi:parvulin-like peptidyl-prolyl isomerase